MRMRTRIAGVVTALCLTAAAASAQDAAAQANARGRGNRAPLDSTPPAELANMLDTYAIVQAQEVLKIDDAKYGQFVTRLKRLQETRRRSQRERNQIVQELRKLAGPQATGPVDEAAIRDRLKALRDHDERAAEALRQAYDSLDEVLDATQQARFRIFEERMEQRKLDLLVRARERAARLNRQGDR